MALLIRDLPVDVSVDESGLQAILADYLGVQQIHLRDVRVVRRSVDARKKQRIRKIYTLQFVCDHEESLLQSVTHGKLEKLVVTKPVSIPKISAPRRVLVVGMGPAGLFAARWLSEAGADVTLIDRGKPVELRVKDVESFWSDAVLDEHSNVQYGEGGAGTFSDGKLTTRLSHPLRGFVLQCLVDHGAPEEILVDAKPHVGTDRLRKVIISLRQSLKNSGVDIRYESCLTRFAMSGSRIQGGILDSNKQIDCDYVILAPGHSARDTYLMLAREGVTLVPKGFALGVRIEHPAEVINNIQYGRSANKLPTADYALRYNDDQTNRGVYSFCMCPGGEVINAASEEGGLVVNGMSRVARNSGYSNSALVVSVTPDDWGATSLGGIDFQKHWETLAFRAGGKKFLAPAQNVMDFVNRGRGPVKSTCRPGVAEAELREVLPNFVYDGLQKALPYFDRKMKGFITSEAVLVGVETRTSAPLRILRNDAGESVSHQGLFPAGEGAGYAGGIMSAAFDGIRAAEKIIESV